ncbi:MAG: hypothetical protein WAM78_07290 [Candidatus Sulfotelmatobacter sp.]
MRFSGLSRVSVIGTSLAILLLSTVTLTAKDGRDFAGSYSFTGVQEQGGMVQLTLHLRMFNYSGADIKGPVVTLREGISGVGLLGTFPAVKTWYKNREVEFSQQFTVPKSDYQDWLRPPAQPNVVIIYQDANGQTWQKGVQMSPRPTL